VSVDRPTARARDPLNGRLAAGDLALRPATLDDAPFAADVFTAARPDDPEDPVLWAYSWRHPYGDPVIERFVGELGGEPVAYAFHRHARWESTPERYGSVACEILPARRSAERLDALLAAMEERSLADGARILTSWAWEDDAPKLRALEARGYKEERRERFWELDLAANRERLERMTEESRARMRAQGVAVLTIDRDADPDTWRKLWHVSEEAERDVPTTVPHSESTFEQFMAGMRSPGAHEDGIWIAREGDAVLGVSLLTYPPVRGVVQTDWTAMARAARGRGIARALKCETVMQAIALGVDRVRTDNDSMNAPILHINETMGYRRLADMIQLLKPGQRGR
jgi:hypothetical protein